MAPTERDGQRWTERAFGLLQVGLRLAAAWPDAWPSNCLLWALKQMALCGGSIVLSRSAYGPWLHAQWRAPDGSLWEYNPPTKQAQETVPALFVGTPHRVSPPTVSIQ